MHWYNRDGFPCYTQIGADGKERNTDLRDARKLRLYPGSTGIIGQLDKVGLNKWLINELIEAALEHPYNPYDWETKDKWIKYAKASMSVKSKKASDRGTEIHDKLEDYYKTGNICKRDEKYITPAIKLIDSQFENREWVAEGTYTDLENGYAGSVDLHCGGSDPVVIDFKTKDKTDVKEMKQYKEHKMQLASYQNLLKYENARRYNLFISVHPDTPGLCILRECKEYEKYLRMFLLLNELWQLTNNYYPTEGVN
jgi:hypothetical protein